MREYVWIQWTEITCVKNGIITFACHSLNSKVFTTTFATTIAIPLEIPSLLLYITITERFSSMLHAGATYIDPCMHFINDATTNDCYTMMILLACCFYKINIWIGISHAS